MFGFEHVQISLNDERYDEVVHSGVKECGDLEFCLKRNALVGGGAGVAVTFTVVLPDGSKQRVQAVTTLKAFVLAARALDAAPKT